MKKFLSKIIYGSVVVEAICFLVLGFMAYFVSSFDKTKGMMSDGLGRVLYESPFIVRFIFGEGRLWPGWGWFAIDMIVFWGGIAIGYWLIQVANRLEG
ncbi:hypothetical protein ACFL36_05325 [Thermodesulfobacteriota bacterium]